MSRPSCATLANVATRAEPQAASYSTLRANAKLAGSGRAAPAARRSLRLAPCAICSRAALLTRRTESRRLLSCQRELAASLKTHYRISRLARVGRVRDVDLRAARRAQQNSQQATATTTTLSLKPAENVCVLLSTLRVIVARHLNKQTNKQTNTQTDKQCFAASWRAQS